MYLVDTSVWIAFFSKKPGFHLADILRPEEICIVLPIYQEVLQGIKDESYYRIVRSALLSASFVENPLSRDVFDDAISLSRVSRRSGEAMRSPVDCVIAACALRHNLTVLHRDRDYERIARFTALKVRS